MSTGPATSESSPTSSASARAESPLVSASFASPGLVWMALACLLLLAAMAVPLCLGRVYVADDLGAYHLPLRAYYAQQLKAGEAFDWLPGLYNGYYLTGEGQLGTYHPLHWLLYRWLPLTAAFDLELLLSYPALLAGSYLLLRRRIGRADAALFGALVFTFSGFSLLHFVHPNAVAVVAHLPWMLWALDIALTTGQPRTRSLGWAGLSLLLGSQLLLGYPQYVWFSLLVIGPYALSRLSGDWPARRRSLLRLSVALVIGLLIGGIQLVPTCDALATSVRPAADASFTNAGSLHPLNLLQLVGPYLFSTRVAGQNTHELGLFVGAVPLLLCVWLFTRRDLWQRHRPLIVAATVLGIAGLLLASGEYGLVYPLQRWLPLVGRFRFPCRAIVLVNLAVAVLAAVGLLLLSERRGASQRQQGSRRALSIVVALSAAVAIAGPLLWPEFVAGPALVWAGPLMLAVAAVVLTAAERGSRAALAMLVLLTAADLGAYGLSYGIWRQSADLDTFAAAPTDGPRPGDVVVAETTADHEQHLHVSNQLLLAGLRRADGYAGLEPARQLDYSHSDVQRLAGAHWQATDLGENSGAARHWQAVPGALERVRLATKAIVSAGLLPAAALAADTAVLEQPLAQPLDLPADEPGRVTVVADRGGRLVLDTDAPTRQLLVVATSYHAGWRATVDGHAEPVVRVNRDFLGCPIAAGAHRVELQFRPRSLEIGGALSSLGLGLWGCLLLVALVRRPTDAAAQRATASRVA